MDYYKIGQRIRKYRKVHNLSQEQLSEKIGISVTHMSHIETGNTKLSLPVLVDIAVALQVRTDDLIFDTPSFKDVAHNEINEIITNNKPESVRVMEDVIKALNLSLQKHIHI